MGLLRRTLTSVGILLFLSALALGQETKPETRAAEPPKLDYSFCRFDSTTIALMQEYTPRPILHDLSSGGMQAHFLPMFMTAIDVNFGHPDSTSAYKVLYSNNGQTFASLVVLKRGKDGTYTPTWTTQSVAPAPRVKLRALDLNGDGQLDVIASAHGGEPRYEAMNAFEFNDQGLGRPLVRDSRSPYDPKATFGIAYAVIDSLGRNGRPAIEVWHDDSTHAGSGFVRARLQYSDSARVFLPETVDTLKELPSWCSNRRPAATKR